MWHVVIRGDAYLESAYAPSPVPGTARPRLYATQMSVYVDTRYGDPQGTGVHLPGAEVAVEGFVPVPLPLPTPPPWPTPRPPATPGPPPTQGPPPTPVGR